MMTDKAAKKCSARRNEDEDTGMATLLKRGRRRRPNTCIQIIIRQYLFSTIAYN